jgi:hypothetical protein
LRKTIIIFQDSTLLTQGHAAVLLALQRAGVDVIDGDGERVTEARLKSDKLVQYNLQHYSQINYSLSVSPHGTNRQPYDGIYATRLID